MFRVSVKIWHYVREYNLKNYWELQTIISLVDYLVALALFPCGMGITIPSLLNPRQIIRGDRMFRLSIVIPR